MVNAPVKNLDMARGRQKSQFEIMAEQAAFRVTREQLEWLRSASVEAGVEAGLSEWLRQLAVREGEKLLGKPFPRRKLIESPRKKSR